MIDSHRNRITKHINQIPATVAIKSTIKHQATVANNLQCIHKTVQAQLGKREMTQHLTKATHQMENY
jgi:hypothetical protein